MLGPHTQEIVVYSIIREPNICYIVDMLMIMKCKSESAWLIIFLGLPKTEYFNPDKQNNLICILSILLVQDMQIQVTDGWYFSS